MSLSSSLKYTAIEVKDYEKVYAKIKDPKFTPNKIAQVLHTKMVIPLHQAQLICESYWSNYDRKDSIFKVLRAVKALQNGINPEDLDLEEVPEAILNKRLHFEKSSSSNNTSKLSSGSKGSSSSSKATKKPSSHLMPRKNFSKIVEDKMESAEEEEDEIKKKPESSRPLESSRQFDEHEGEKEEESKSFVVQNTMEAASSYLRLGEKGVENNESQNAIPFAQEPPVKEEIFKRDQSPTAMVIGAMQPPEEDDDVEIIDNNPDFNQNEAFLTKSITNSSEFPPLVSEEPPKAEEIPGKDKEKKGTQKIEEKPIFLEDDETEVFKAKEESFHSNGKKSPGFSLGTPKEIMQNGKTSESGCYLAEKEKSERINRNFEELKEKESIIEKEFDEKEELDLDEDFLSDFLVIDRDDQVTNTSFVNEEHFPLQQRHRNFDEFSVVAQKSKELMELLSQVSPNMSNKERKEGKRHVSITKHETMREGIMGMKAYVLFTIVVDGKEDQAVYRRYSEFSKFHEYLSSMVAFQGMILPELPDKVYLKNYDEATLRERKRKLERYLHILINSPVFGENECVRRFMEERNRMKFLDWFKGIQHSINMNNKSYSLKMSEYLEFIRVKTSMLMVIKKNSVEEMNKLAEVKEKMTFIEKSIYGLEEIYDKIVEQSTQTFGAFSNFVESYKHQTQDFEFAMIKDCISITASCFQVVDERNNFELRVQRKVKKLGIRFRKINEEISKLYRINSEYVTSYKYKQAREKSPQSQGLDFSKTASEIEDYLRLHEQKMKCICNNLLVEIKFLIFKV